MGVVVRRQFINRVRMLVLAKFARVLVCMTMLVLVRVRVRRSVMRMFVRVRVLVLMLVFIFHSFPPAWLKTQIRCIHHSSFQKARKPDAVPMLS